MKLFPFQFRTLSSGVLFSNPAGDFFQSDERLLGRMAVGDLQPTEWAFLQRQGFACEDPGDFYYNSFRQRLHEKKAIPNRLNYIIAVPTLRCDLSCRYCQVSRVGEKVQGYDWSEETLARFLSFLDHLESSTLKLEFQGGEPILRMDLLERIIAHCQERFDAAEFVICTALNTLPNRLLRLMAQDNVYLSTSLDGPSELHSRNRTRSPEATRRFENHLRRLLDSFGPERIHFLPTVMPNDFHRLPEIIDAYRAWGCDGIYLRSASFHGFARKQLPTEMADQSALADRWVAAYSVAMEHLFRCNTEGGPMIREFNLSQMLRRIFKRSANHHVDLRSPNPAARDALLVNWDGRFYPSDEARMLAAIGHSDLSIGSLACGYDQEKIAQLNWNQMNEVHESCIHCVYQAYCGIDMIDDLARCDRIDVPKEGSWFCRVQMGLFDFVFNKLLGNNPVDLFNLSGHLNGHFSHTPFYGRFYYDPA
ncbi:MAG: radical SAM protein [Magnetococcales bacterium]|nr:radical SAM protein [Magnetococcales bacterium]